MARHPSPAAVAGAVGDVPGPSRWFSADEARIDGFADVTEDRRWTHVDPERAAAGPAGMTVAHGYLTLSPVAPVAMEILTVDRLHSAVKYGLNRVRFPAVVRPGHRIRGSAAVIAAGPIEPGAQVVLRTTADGTIVRSARPSS